MDNTSQLKVAPTIIFVMTLCLNTFNIGYNFCELNLMVPTIKRVLDLSDEELLGKVTLLQSSGVLGCVLGSLSGGKFIENGRAKAIRILNIVGLAFLILKVIPQYELMVLGKLIQGLYSGVSSCAVARIIEETVPENLIGSFGNSTNLSIVVGCVISVLMGVPLCRSEAYFESDLYWRVVLLVPLISNLSSLICFSTIYR